MAVKAAVATGTVTGSSSTTDFTVSGFGTVQAAIIILGEAYTTANPAANARMSIGVWDGTNVASCSVVSENAVGTTDTYRVSSTTYAATIPSVTDGTIQVGWTISPVADGVRLTHATGSATLNRYCTAILLNGLTNRAVGSVSLGTGTSAINVTAPGFRADLVFTLNIGHNATGETAVAILTFGAAQINASDTVSQGCILFGSSDNVGDAVVSIQVRDDAISGQYANDSLTYAVGAGAHASGFTLTPTASASSDILYYLAIELPDPDDAYVAIKDTKTSTGTQAYTGAGFTPQALILGLTAATSVNTNAPDSSWAIGATDGTTSRCIGIVDEDGEGTTDTESWMSTDVLQITLGDGVATETDCVAAYSSFDSDGWTLNYSDPSASTRKMLAIAIGNSVTAISLTGATSTQKNQGGTGVVTQVQKLSAAVGTQANQSGTGAITQAQVLASALATEAHQSSTGAVSLAATLTSAASTQANQAGTGAAAQTHVLTAAGATQANEASTGSLGGAASLTSAASTQANNALAAAISQSQILVSAAAVQANQSGTGTLTGATTLTGADSVQANESGTGTAVVVHHLAASDSTSAAQGGTGAITAFHQLVAAGSIQVNQSGTGRLAGVAGWICATASAYPAVTATLGLSPAVTADTEVYPRGCH